MRRPFLFGENFIIFWTENPAPLSAGSSQKKTGIRKIYYEYSDKNAIIKENKKYFYIQVNFTIKRREDRKKL